MGASGMILVLLISTTIIQVSKIVSWSDIKFSLAVGENSKNGPNIDFYIIPQLSISITQLFIFVPCIYW